MLAKQRMELGLTLPDQKKVNTLFSRFDFDGDGKIQEGESGGAFPESITNQYLQYDSNADGVVTISEVEKSIAASRREKGYIEEDFQQAVKMLKRHDENRSNHIEEYELFDKPKPGQLPKSLFKRADLNEDQRLGIDELARYFAAQRKSK